MDYIEISGYKSIKQAKIDISPVNILIGSNGSGKSNFLSFFDFLNRLCEGKLNEYVALKGGTGKILHKGNKITNKIYFEIQFYNGKNGYSVLLKAGAEGFVFLEENLIYQGDAKNIAHFDTEASVSFTDAYRAKYIIRYLSRLRKYHFHDTSTNSAFSKYSHIEDDHYYLYSDGMNIATFLYYIRETDKTTYHRIVKNIQSIAPYFSDFYLVPNKAGYIRLQWKDKYTNIIYGANDLSDGTLRFIALSVLFLQSDLPNTIIIDEPELGLHPFAIAKLAGMIQSVANKGCQVIVATQSTDLISYFTPGDIITTDLIDGETVFKRLDSRDLQKWLDDYTLDDLWKQNIITGGHPNYTK